MDLGIRGRTALVLGSSQGLGRAAAQALAREGVSVILTGRSPERLAAAAAILRADGAEDVATELIDLSDSALLAGWVERMGARGIDILVINGGGPPPGPIPAVDADTWRRQFDTMVNAPMQIAAGLLPGMRQRKWGRIVNILSSGVVQPIPNLGISNTLRMSLVGWAKTLSGEVASDGITVNSVVPGRIHTGRTDELDRLAAMRANKTPQEIAQASCAAIPMGRYGRPEEFADAVAFMASERARYITGTILRVDGGMVRGI